ncbi:MAG: hypothetical protein JWP44_4924 [Mucilaginibacter sp.]|nr:hypothetical protein [Mucilaginibacter sp.]
MEAFYDPTRVYPTARLHPYTGTGANQSGYIDFKASPEQIASALEDFRPFAHREAVQVFYGLLREINGSDSHFETSDCAFRQPAPHRDAHSQHALCAFARLYILFRTLPLNCSSAHTDWLAGKLLDVLRQIDPTMTATDGVVALTLTEILHTGLSNGIWLDGQFDCPDDDPGFGKHLMLSFFAYGDDEDQAYDNLSRVFRNIGHACGSLSEEIAASLKSNEESA